MHKYELSFWLFIYEFFIQNLISKAEFSFYFLADYMHFIKCDLYLRYHAYFL